MYFNVFAFSARRLLFPMASQKWKWLRRCETIECNFPSLRSSQHRSRHLIDRRSWFFKLLKFLPFIQTTPELFDHCPDEGNNDSPLAMRPSLMHAAGPTSPRRLSLRPRSLPTNCRIRSESTQATHSKGRTGKPSNNPARGSSFCYRWLTIAENVLWQTGASHSISNRW